LTPFWTVLVFAFFVSLSLSSPSLLTYHNLQLLSTFGYACNGLGSSKPSIRPLPTMFTSASVHLAVLPFLPHSFGVFNACSRVLLFLCRTVSFSLHSFQGISFGASEADERVWAVLRSAHSPASRKSPSSIRSPLGALPCVPGGFSHWCEGGLTVSRP